MTLHRLDGFNTVCRCGQDIGQIFRCRDEDFCSQECVHRYVYSAGAGHHPTQGEYNAQTGCLSYPRRVS